MLQWFKKIFKKTKTTTAWGGAQVLWDTPFVKVTHIWVEPGKSSETFTSQEFAVKTWLFFKGSGDYTVGVMKKKIINGINATITSGNKHFINAGGDKVEVLEIQSGEKVVQQPLQLPPSSNQ
jgi:mannose-6-phosphate isomerase-like protein (cupin superfamily)